MRPSDFAQLAQAAEAKLAKGEELSRQERILLLSAMLLRQDTRRERRYGLP